MADRCLLDLFFRDYPTIVIRYGCAIIADEILSCRAFRADWPGLPVVTGGGKYRDVSLGEVKTPYRFSLSLWCALDQMSAYPTGMGKWRILSSFP